MLFKYITLVLDYFLTFCYLRSLPSKQTIKQSQHQHINIIAYVIVIIPPILHTFTFICTPHCYVGHCKPSFKYKIIKEVQPEKQKQKDNNNDNKNDENDENNENESNKQQKQNVNQLQAFKNIRQLGGIKQYLSPYKHDSDSNKQQLSPSPKPFQLTNQKLSNSNNKYNINNINSPINKNIHNVYNNTQNDKNNQNNTQQLFQCKQCKLTKWIRMQHCYNCKICVHKYDHHCVLLGICIGQANQKYYLPYLWIFLFSSVVQTIHYYNDIGMYLYLDQKGYQHMEIQYITMSFGIIFFVASIVVVGYLALYHTWLALYNQTTYQMKKRMEIKYLQGVYITHPFDKGCQNNIKMICKADKNNPIEWERPKRANYNIFQVSSVHNESQQMGNAKYSRSNSDILNQFDKTIESGKKISKSNTATMIQMQNLSQKKNSYS